MEVPATKPEKRISMDDIGRDESKAAVMQKGGTAVDEREMIRMGKKQELRVCRHHAGIFGCASADIFKRNFKFVGIVSFVTILQSTWECTILANWFGLFNGGTAGLIWCTIAVWICFMV